MIRAACVFATSAALFIPLTGCFLACNPPGPGGGGTNDGALQPNQPGNGPGGNVIVSQNVTKAKFGTGTTAYWLYEPANPAPASAPVIAFLHGFGGVNPKAYGAWIRHLVLRGNSVIFPVYQTSLMNADEYTDDAITAILDGLTVLASPGHVAPETDKFALVGHSLGGVIVANIAALAPSKGLPAVRCLMSAHPGDANATVPTLPSIKQGNYASVGADVLFLGIVGSADTVVGSDEAITIFDGLSNIAAGNRQVLEFFSDDYGDPDLVANHGAPLAADDFFDSGESLSGGTAVVTGVESPGPDAFDFFGYWKLFDALMDAAFEGTNKDIALGGGDAQRSLGTWSDGTPVRQAEVIRPIS